MPQKLLLFSVPLFVAAGAVYVSEPPIPSSVPAPAREPVAVVEPPPAPVLAAKAADVKRIEAAVQSVAAVSSVPEFACEFQNGFSECGFGEQSALEEEGKGRATLAYLGRTDGSSIRLRTEPGDSEVHGSGNWERNDLMLAPNRTYCNEKQEEWWADSIMFSDDYVFPPGPEAGILFDFHHDASSGQANLELQTIPGIGLRLEGHGGEHIDDGRFDIVISDPYGAPAGSVVKNKWYDFVYHIRWSSGSDGFAEAWLNGAKVAAYDGPTLYRGISCYLKLANYHAAFKAPSSIIHDRVLRGVSAAAVSLTPLAE